MINDIIHPVEEFYQINWSKFKPDDFGKKWSFGRGGYGLRDNQYTISYIHENLLADIWVLPDILSLMLKVNEENGSYEAKRQIKIALGIN
jgi:hypothetical protein